MKSRERWKGSLTGTGDDSGLPTNPPRKPIGYNIENPEPNKIYYWEKGLPQSREK